MTNPLPPIPAGFRLALDRDTLQLDRHTMFGGSPSRVMRLTAGGLSAWTELRHGPVVSSASGMLARRLTDAGLAHPCPPDSIGRPDVTVIVPVRDRASLLAQCLSALGNRYPVVVVDDGSTKPQALADIAIEYGAQLIRRARNGGPAAARNTGLARVDSELIAFLDSDCVPPDGWLEALAVHFADPLVAAVAPRIVAAAVGPRSSATRYGAANGSLDLGPRAARVAPSTRVAYVPTAALIVRREALLALGRDASVFDPGLRYGEDVDLIWRLHEAGWRIRYDPSVQVRHHEPASWPSLLTRRFHYGTSAAPLSRRHPSAMAPLRLTPLPVLTVGALLARRPALAALGLTLSTASMARALRRADLPRSGAMGATLTATRQTWLGLGRYSTQFAPVLLAAGLLAPSQSCAGRRIAAASLLLGGPLTAWFTRRPPLDPLRFTLGHIADDVAYGAGVWTGCIRNRVTIPVRPVISWRSLRIGTARSSRTKGLI